MPENVPHASQYPPPPSMWAWLVVGACLVSMMSLGIYVAWELDGGWEQIRLPRAARPYHLQIIAIGPLWLGPLAVTADHIDRCSAIARSIAGIAAVCTLLGGKWSIGRIFASRRRPRDGYPWASQE